MHQPNPSRRQRAFTLIELILVMALLVSAMALVVPSLSGFFAGRDLDSEVHRFVSLTHYGQDRATGEGIPMLLWIDPQANSYGLQQETGYMGGTDKKSVEYTVAEGIKITLDRGTSKAPVAGKSYGIHFSPDGNVVTATSVQGIYLQQGKNPAIYIAPAFNGLTYEVKTNGNYAPR